MNIEHKMTPVEHWIVDGKAYRLATEADVGKEVSSTDHALQKGRSRNAVGKLNGVDRTTELPFSSRGTYWKFAYIQDDSLLTPQRVPVPALGDGWFLLTAEDGEIKSGDKIKAGYKGIVTWTDLPHGHKWAISTWIRDGHEAARYFGVAEPIASIAEEAEPVPTGEPAIDWTKPVRTKDGRAVRVLCTDGPGDYPVVGIVANEWIPYTWDLDGVFDIESSEHSDDLENIPPEPKRITIERWVNVYDSGATYEYDTKIQADRSANHNRFACVKIVIDCEEGEGL